MNDAPPSAATQSSKSAGIDWLATTAGALAAVTSALLLSTLGAVGTLVGAAIGSVAANVGTNLYAQWLAKSREKVTSVQALARWRSAGLAGVRTGAEPATAAATQVEEDSAEGSGDAESAPSWRERLATLPWKRISVLSLAMFVVVVASITAFELLAGRSVSSIVGDGDGRTTISGVTGGGSDSRDEEPRKDPSSDASATPDESASASTEPSEDAEASEDAATEGPSTEPSSSTDPSASPTAQPSEGGSASSEPSPTTGTSPEATDQTSP